MNKTTRNLGFNVSTLFSASDFRCLEFSKRFKYYQFVLANNNLFNFNNSLHGFKKFERYIDSQEGRLQKLLNKNNHQGYIEALSLLGTKSESIKLFELLNHVANPLYDEYQENDEAAPKAYFKNVIDGCIRAHAILWLAERSSNWKDSIHEGDSVVETNVTTTELKVQRETINERQLTIFEKLCLISVLICIPLFYVINLVLLEIQDVSITLPAINDLHPLEAFRQREVSPLEVLRTSLLDKSALLTSLTDSNNSLPGSDSVILGELMKECKGEIVLPGCESLILGTMDPYGLVKQNIIIETDYGRAIFGGMCYITIFVLVWGIEWSVNGKMVENGTDLSAMIYPSDAIEAAAESSECWVNYFKVGYGLESTTFGGNGYIDYIYPF